MFSFKKTIISLVVFMMSQTVSSGSALDLSKTESTTETRFLQQGREEVFELQAETGDYIEHGWQVNSGRFNLDSINRLTGAHIRRFVFSNAGRSPFLLVVEDTPINLKVSAIETGHYTLFIIKQVGTEHQNIEQNEYLSPRIANLADHLKSGGSTDVFWTEIEQKGTPLIEDNGNNKSILTFLARGARTGVRLLGAPTSNHEELEQLAGSDVWFKSFIVPNTTRLSYQLAVDVPVISGTWMERRRAILATLAADPLNKHPWPANAIDPYNQHSTVLLPAAEAGHFLGNQTVAKGQVTHSEIESKGLGNKRDIWLYRSAGYEASKATAPLLIMFDAEHYKGRISVPDILDNMVADGAIPPLATVFVSHIDSKTRTQELPNNAQFAAFVAEELLPFAQAELGISATPERTILAGSSFGGLASSTISLRYPQHFGNVLSMSGSYWYSEENDENYVANLIANTPHQDIRFFLSAGLFEKSIGGGDRGILQSSQHLRDVLLARNYEVKLEAYASGHDLFSWQTILSDGLIYLIGKGAP
ncbi:Enterochelin esterase [Pseudovibrio sp. Ad5]|nr:Enterochelin esterase [Pseudovibrio sp. Ad5]